MQYSGGGEIRTHEDRTVPPLTELTACGDVTERSLCSEPGKRKAQAGGGVEETTPADQPGRTGSTPVPRLGRARSRAFMAER